MGLEDNTTAEFDDIPETADTETIQDDNSAGSMETPETANTGIMETNDFSRWSHVTHWQKATCRTYWRQRRQDIIQDINQDGLEVTADTPRLISGVTSGSTGTEHGAVREPDKPTEEERLWRWASTVHP